MLKVVLALCLIGSLVNGQVSFPTGTLTANQVYTTGSGSSQVQAGSATQGTNGWTVGLSTPGWVLSNNLGLVSPPASGSTSQAITVFTTLKRAVGGYVGVGLALTSGTSSSGGCTAFSTTHSTATLADGAASASTLCPTDFLSVYTSIPSPTDSVITASQATLVVNTPIRWVMTPPTVAQNSASTTAQVACVQTTITPFSAIGGATPSAGTVTTKNTFATTNGACEGTAADRFSLTTGSSASGGTAITQATFAFYVELGSSGTGAEVCFQTQAQFDANPGVCSSSIITGVLASVGLLVALLFN